MVIMREGIDLEGYKQVKRKAVNGETIVITGSDHEPTAEHTGQTFIVKISDNEGNVSVYGMGYMLYPTEYSVLEPIIRSGGGTNGSI